MKIICSRKPRRFVKASASRNRRIMAASPFKRKFTVKASKNAVYSDYDYKATSYYGLDYKGVEDSIETDDYSELESFAWKKAYERLYSKTYK